MYNRFINQRVGSKYAMFQQGKGTCYTRLHTRLDKRNNDAETAGLGGVVDGHVAEVIPILQWDSGCNQSLQNNCKFLNLIHKTWDSEDVHLDHDDVLELAGEMQRSGTNLVPGRRHSAQAQEELEGLLVPVAAGAEKRLAIGCVIHATQSKSTHR